MPSKASATAHPAACRQESTDSLQSRSADVAPQGWLDVTAKRFSRWLADRWEKVRIPSLDWIQVGVTSRCNALCSYCPRTVCGSAWADRDLPIETFSKLLPAFGKTGMVHLQGWGEPFLHPGFFEMVSLTKRAGCAVGTTTNGTLLRHALLERIA